MNKNNDPESFSERRKPAKTELTATEAVKNFGELGFRAARGETVVVKRHGRPIFEICAVKPDRKE